MARAEPPLDAGRADAGAEAGPAGSSTGDQIEATIRRLLAPGKGLLAADESPSTIERRFARVDIVSTEETRRAYRELLFTAPGMRPETSSSQIWRRHRSSRRSVATGARGSSVGKYGTAASRCESVALIFAASGHGLE